MIKILSILRTLEKKKLASLIAAVSLVVIGSILALIYLTRPQYDLLYANLSLSDSSEIVRILEAQRQPYRIEDNGQTLLAPRESIGSLRVAIAEQGLPSSASVGYEIFDRDEGFGTSSFVQEVNRLRALEGELARTITSIRAIASARVHLVLPKRELFSRDTQKPSASIILKLVRGNSLDNKQVRAIQNLIAAAIPNLEAGQISIIDDKGTLLARGGGEESTFFGNTPEEIRTQYETRLSSQLESLIGNIVGRQNVRVEISAELDFSQTVINEENFDPDGQVLRSSEEITENSTRSETTPDPVTVTTNLPEEEFDNQGQGPQIAENSARTEIRRNFDISTRRVNRVVAPGQIQRLSVAVLIDGTYTKNEDGTSTYASRSDNELAEIERLVKSAIGYDIDGRQDKIDIVNLQFVEEDLLAETEATLILGLPAGDFRHLVELVVLSLVALVVFLVVIRPLLNSAIRKGGGLSSAEISAQVEQKRNALIARGVPASEANVIATAAAGEQILAQTNDGSVPPSVALARATAAGGDVTLQRQLLSQLNELVEKNPQESANALRTWLVE